MSDTGYTADTAPAKLRAAYRWLEPDPNAEYGTLLPFARDPLTGTVRWALPSIARDSLGGMLDLMAAVETGEVTPRAAMQLGLGGLGAGGALAPRGALAVGGARLELPKDLASRLQRARDLGFNTDLPLYHGTGASFRRFSLTPRTPPLKREGVIAPGIWTTESPELAGQFAMLRAAEGLPGQRPNILPLFARYRKDGDIDMTGRPFRYVTEAIKGAFYDGYDAVRLLNYSADLPRAAGETVWVFRDPKQLRSRFALFDPARSRSSDLTAGFAVPGPAPVPGMRVPPDTNPPGLHTFRRMMDERRVY